MTRRGLTLVEVLMAVVLLAAVVIACLPLLRPRPAVVASRPSMMLSAAAAGEHTPPGARVATFEANAGQETQGQWRVITTEASYGLVWINEDDQP